MTRKSSPDEFGAREAKERFEAALRGSRVAKPKSYEESKVGKARKPDGRGAAKGLTLDNLEDRAIGLRTASEPTRQAVKARTAANRGKAKQGK